MSGELPSAVAIDLGAESCRISLLTWENRKPIISLVHRFSNAPIAQNNSLHWPLDHICSELETALRQCASTATRPIASIGVDGWAVDYVRLKEDGTPLALPHCYRDPRTEAAEAEVEKRISREELFTLSGVQPLRINTLYQLVADNLAGIPSHAPWINLPEYILMRLGSKRIAEFTNATHTGLVDAKTPSWNKEILTRCGLDAAAAPVIEHTSAKIGRLSGPLSEASAFKNTALIAPCCHDTASAVAGIPLHGDDWAYISSGTWSLVGMLLDHSICTPQAFHAGFTNFGAAGNGVCFHKNVNGMWLLRQCLDHLSPGHSILELIAAAERLPAPRHLLDVDDPDLLLHGEMASRINAQRIRKGLSPLEETAAALPQFASLIFHSLAARYAEVLHNAAGISGRKLKRLSIVGGGSLNQFLNRLTAEATGLDLVCGVPESSTVGNFAVQLAALEDAGRSRERIAYWAAVLTHMRAC